MSEETGTGNEEEAQDGAESRGAWQPPTRWEQQERQISKLLRAQNGDSDEPDEEEPPDEQTTTEVDMSPDSAPEAYPVRATPRPKPQAAAPALPNAFMEFYNKASDPNEQRPVSLQVPGILTIELRVFVFVTSDHQSITLLLPPYIMLRPEVEMAYLLKVGGRTYKAVWVGACIELPGFPWKILNFVTCLENDDQTRSSHTRENAVVHQRETI